MSEMSQALTVVGLIFEFLSIAYTARRVFPPARSKKERKKRYLEELVAHPTIAQKLESIEKEWYVVLGLLSIGLILQGIAIFV